MPIIAREDGNLTISPKFDHEAFVWLEHPSIDPAEVGPALGLPAGTTRPGQPGEATNWMCRVDPDTDPGTTLAGVADRLAAATDFLTRVRAEGGRYGCLMLCHVDFNAGFNLTDVLLRRLGALRIDLTLHALDVEMRQTAEGRRRLEALLDAPPSRPPTDLPQLTKADADDPP